MSLPATDIREALATRPNVLALIECPTPQRNWVMDRLGDGAVRPLVVYMEPGGEKQGWGRLPLSHLHAFASLSQIRTLIYVVGYLLRCPRDTLVMSFGVRRPLRVAALLVSRLRGLQVVTRSDTSIHTVSADSRFRRFLRRTWWRVLLPRRTRVWTVGEANEQFWKCEMGLRNILRIPYSMPSLPAGTGARPERRTSDPAALTILYVGRLSSEKRVDLLLNAFRALSEPTYREWKLTIIGDGPLRADLQSAALDDERVAFLGKVEHAHLDQHYATADALVLPSDREAWGLVVTEALGFGLWVIVSDAVGAAEQVCSDESGTVFRVGDTEHLIEKLKEARQHLERQPRPLYDPTVDMRKDLTELLASNGGLSP